MTGSITDEGSSSSYRSPPLKLLLTPRAATPENERLTFQQQIAISSSPPNSFSSGLKLKLRGIQAALRAPVHQTDLTSARSYSSSTCKRTSVEAPCDDDFDTDSEIDIMPPPRKAVRPTVEKSAARTSSRKAKRVKITHDDSDFNDDDDAMFDPSDEDIPRLTPDNQLVLYSNVLKRSERILDPANPEHARLIAAAPKAGSEYYDSDADDLPGSVKDTNKPHLFRNVKWGSLATDHSNPTDFTTEPEFTQFVPGRYELLPSGIASDQKRKLIIKLTDKQHRQRIFLNPPPCDWNNQEAITTLNKRTVQQIRRNTPVRFREVVEPYVKEEREWILAHLTDGKPTGGWKRFVKEFNRAFEGRVLEVGGVRRPERSHSSLTKEVERFGKMYARGVVPKTVVQAKGGKKARARKAE
ncbi:hypothetical protein SLS59_008629 [Nothophoma quercina]|uniref:Uncharacterized protein n=1 Tax=Nothophoma quercina TaxID=749835 RepID=A0ABR3QRN0_9PLEO